MEPTPTEPVAALAERVARVEARLDDVTRQRVLGRIHQALGEAERARQSGRRRLRLAALALVASALLAGGFRLLRAPRPGALVSAPAQRAQPRPVAVLEPGAMLTPFLVSGVSAQRAEQLLAQPQRRLELAAGERVWAQLGQRARLSLQGPARIEVRALAADAIALELEAGTLLGDYDHARGGLLSIRSPGTTTDIVGTVFLVQASAGQTRVAVAEGEVRVRRAGKLLAVTHDQALPAAADAVVEAPPADLSALREHQSGFVPEPGAHGILGLTGPELLARIEGRLLGTTPLWVRMPIGAHTISLTSRAGDERQLQATVRAEQKTELVLAEAVPGAQPTVPRPAPALATSRGAQRGVGSAPAADAAQLYRDAEAALRAAQPERASELLAQLVRLHPRAPSVDVALYELAELALRAEDYGSARRWLAQLAQHGARPALEEPAGLLRCQTLRVDPSTASYGACMSELRARFPASPRPGLAPKK